MVLIMQPSTMRFWAAEYVRKLNDYECSMKDVLLNWERQELNTIQNHPISGSNNLRSHPVQGGWGGWPTGNGRKLSSSQAQLGQATCLALA